MSDFEQLSMFGEDSGLAPHEAHGEGQDADALQPETPFEEALEVYLIALRLGGASPHTVKAFKSDLNLLGRWAGKGTEIGAFSTARLNEFLHWMLTERDKPCSPKTYARRVTTLKNFFGYLHEQEAIPRDPSAAVIQRPATRPLPELLQPEEIDAVLGATQSMRRGEKPDARPHLLVTLLLETGIKKGECMSLTPADVMRSLPGGPQIWIRYKNPRMRYKERKIGIDPAWLGVLDEYLGQRQPQEAIFDCTARNLEYVLRDVADEADVERGKLSFEALRWTCAYRDYIGGMDPERLREKLGLSRISWRDTNNRLDQLAEEFGDEVPARE